MFSKLYHLFFLICVLTYGVQSEGTLTDQKTLEKINKLDIKVKILENEIGNRDKILKTVFAEEIAELRAKISLNSTQSPTVAFSAYRPNKDHYEKGDIFLFENVPLNIGNGYDGSNGKFTAPESGLYQFFLHVCNARDKNVASAIVHDQVDIAYSVQVSPYDSCSTVTALRMVEKGQKIFVRCTYSTWFLRETSLYRRSSFSGVMLHPK